MRVRGVDTIFALFKKLNAENRAFIAYFLGGTSGVAETAKKNMEARFPCLTVLGFHHGFCKDDTAILAEINATSPDILLVCTGMPRAEIWATKNKHAHTRLTLCLGGTLDIMASKAKLAPAFMRKIGLEWFYRLLRQPSRFFRMLALPKFLFFVLTQARKH
jgi:N-acetylglucosaminyldiphosphoundecaprenol N-acetyl-beta-D-mannosaminyltransferase